MSLEEPPGAAARLQEKRGGAFPQDLKDTGLTLIARTLWAIVGVLSNSVGRLSYRPFAVSHRIAASSARLPHPVSVSRLRSIVSRPVLHYVCANLPHVR